MAFAGRKLRFKYDADGAGGAAAVEVARAKSDGFSITVEGIDITSKDDNGVRTFLDDVGVTSWEGNVSGVLTDSTLLTLMANAGEGTALHYFEITVGNLGTAAGTWLISNWSSSGAEGSEAATFECTLQSSGAISWTAA